MTFDGKDPQQTLYMNTYETATGCIKVDRDYELSDTKVGAHQTIEDPKSDRAWASIIPKSWPCMSIYLL
jgi:hypothetical protein